MVSSIREPLRRRGATCAIPRGTGEQRLVPLPVLPATGGHRPERMSPPVRRRSRSGDRRYGELCLWEHSLCGRSPLVTRRSVRTSSDHPRDMARVIGACRSCGVATRVTVAVRSPSSRYWAVALRGERSVDVTEQVSCADAAHVVHDEPKPSHVDGSARPIEPPMPVCPKTCVQIGMDLPQQLVAETEVTRCSAARNVRQGLLLVAASIVPCPTPALRPTSLPETTPRTPGRVRLLCRGGCRPVAGGSPLAGVGAADHLFGAGHLGAPMVMLGSDVDEVVGVERPGDLFAEVCAKGPPVDAAERPPPRDSRTHRRGPPCACRAPTWAHLAPLRPSPSPSRSARRPEIGVAQHRPEVRDRGRGRPA